jgi:mono/diheme cytochrome c family protein
MCHGQTGEGTGPIAAFLIKYKPANLTTDVVQAKSDGSMFMTITNGLEGRMPPLNENLTVSERWDVVNYIRTLKLAE